MIEVDDFELYLKFLNLLKQNKEDTLQQLSTIHESYHQVLFKNSQSKKLYNKNLNFLHILCKANNISIFQELHEKKPEIIKELLNKPNAIGWTPLYFTIKKKNFPFIKALLSLNAEITVLLNTLLP